MTNLLLGISLLQTLLLTCLLVLFLVSRKGGAAGRGILDSFARLESSFLRLDGSFRDDLTRHRIENGQQAKENRDELGAKVVELRNELAVTLKSLTDNNMASLEKLSQAMKDLSGANVLALDKIRAGVQEQLEILSKAAKDESHELKAEVDKSFVRFQEGLDRNMESFGKLQHERFEQMSIKQNDLVNGTRDRLEQIRATVEEKLEKTLSERLGQSFKTVGEQLEAVHKGLGEMQVLAQDVGGLKKVLSNVKMRGGIGEVQLSMLLEHLLAPGQYEANVKVKPGSSEIVEFAVKLPGKDDEHGQIYLPIDAKFPGDPYQELQKAHDANDLERIELAQKMLENAVKKMAKDICEKYIDPPHTTDFAIMFLPFEGLYAEVVRKASLIEDIQRNCKVIITGPSTLAAILNSLQMGFKTLAIQKRSGEVWSVLAGVKKEFETFGGLLDKAERNIQLGLNTIVDLNKRRTNAINRKLSGVENLSDVTAKIELPGLPETILEIEDSGDSYTD